MSALRKCLKHPATYLGVLVLFSAAVLADCSRPPADQWSARIYIAAVGGYQDTASPRLAGYVRCRFHPTCSHYSVEAVRKYGLRKGLLLTSSRLWRCRSSVPLGTDDPVP